MSMYQSVLSYLLFFLFFHRCPLYKWSCELDHHHQLNATATISPVLQPFKWANTSGEMKISYGSNSNRHMWKLEQPPIWTCPAIPLAVNRSMDSINQHKKTWFVTQYHCLVTEDQAQTACCVVLSQIAMTSRKADESSDSSLFRLNERGLAGAHTLLTLPRPCPLKHWHERSHQQLETKGMAQYATESMRHLTKSPTNRGWKGGRGAALIIPTHRPCRFFRFQPSFLFFITSASIMGSYWETFEE